MSEATPANEILLKLLLVGDSGVGKSSILLRLCEDRFDEGGVAATIGVDFKVKMMERPDGKTLNLRIWDTAGQEKFRSLTSSYYRGAQGVILVYDVTKKESFQHVESWLSEVNLYSTNSDVRVLLVGNKIDMDSRQDSRQVTREEGAAFAKRHGMLFIEVSAKTKVGVQQAFEELVEKVLETPGLVTPVAPAGAPLAANPEADQGYCAC